MLEDIVKDGKVTRGWIGVEPNDLSPELAETFGVKAKSGVIITGVLQNGPAARAGVRPGDVITGVGEKKIDNVQELLTAVAGLKPGTAARFALQRGSDKMELDVTPGLRPAGAAAPRAARDRVGADPAAAAQGCAESALSFPSGALLCFDEVAARR